MFNQAGAKRRYPWIFLITVLLSRLSSRQLHSVRFRRVCFCFVGMRGQVNATFFVLIGKFGQISSHLYNVVLGHWSISTGAFTEDCCCFYRHLTECVEQLRWFSGTCQLNIHVNEDLLLSSVKIFQIETFIYNLWSLGSCKSSKCVSCLHSDNVLVIY